MRTLVDNLSDESIERRIKNGFGQGEGSYYKPWLEVSNVSSKGRSARIFNPKLNRKMTCFSDLESRVCNSLIWQDNVIDIREQFPLLPRSETQDIAKQLGVRHPRACYAEFDLVMTTDFLVRKQDSNSEVVEALYVKYEKDLDQNIKEKVAQRNKEKLLIEKEYWRRRGVEFHIITEKNVSKIRTDNISRLLSEYNTPIPDEYSEETINNFIVRELISHPEVSISAYANILSYRLSIEESYAWRLFYRSMARKKIPALIDKEKLIGTNYVSQVIDFEELKKCYLEGAERKIAGEIK